MRQLLLIFLSGILVAACTSTPKSNAPAQRITKVNVNQQMHDSTQWVNGDTVIYYPDGRLAQVDFIHFSYTDSSIVAQCDSTPPNAQNIRHCELVSKPGQPITLLLDYYLVEGRDQGSYSKGEVTYSDSLTSLELSHYSPGYETPAVEHLNWHTDKDGFLTSYDNSFIDYEGTPVSARTTSTYDPASKLTSQDILILAFYMASASFEDLMLMMGGYLPGMLKDIPTRVEMSGSYIKDTVRTKVIPTFDANGRCISSKMTSNTNSNSIITLEY